MYSQTPPAQQEARIRYSEARWEGLHALEEKRIDNLLGYMILVSTGSLAAALAYVGAIIQGGKAMPDNAPTMIGWLFASAVLLGALKIKLFFNIRNVFARWRTGYMAYLDDKKTWDELIRDDEQAAKDDSIVVAGIILAFAFLIFGFYCGYQSLKEVKNGNKPAEAATNKTDTNKTDTPAAPPAIGNPAAKDGHRDADRDVAKPPATAEKVKGEAPAK